MIISRGQLIEAVGIFSLVALITASPAHAEIRTLPGGTTEIAVKRIGCTVVIDGHELINGTCHYRLTKSGEVWMTLPEATTQISINRDRRLMGGGWNLWMQTPDGKVCRGPLGGLIPESGCKRSATNEYLMDCGNCWANERVRICSWPLQADSPPSAAAPSEPAAPRACETYFPLARPAGPPSPGEQQINELSEGINRMLEKITKQPR